MTKPSFAARPSSCNALAVFGRQTRRYLIRRISALLCLGAFMMNCADLLPLITALAAKVDAQHEVLIENTQGGVCVRLQHTAGNTATDRRERPHKHGLTCALMCGLFAQSGQKADHVLAFAVETTCEESSEDSGRFEAGNSGGSRIPLGLATSRMFLAAHGWFYFQTTSIALPEQPNAPPPLQSARQFCHSVSFLI